MFNITLETCEDISCFKALEYLAMGWKPYTDHDERMLDESREYTRCPFNDKKPRVISWDQEEYFDKMHNGLAALQCLIRTKKLKMYTNNVIKLEFGSEKSPFDEELSQKEIDDLENIPWKSAIIMFGEYNKDNKTIIDKGYYEISVKIENEKGIFYYDDVTLKFSEIEPYYTPDNPEKEEAGYPIASGIKKYDGYVTPYMEIMFEVIEENNLSHTNQGNVESLRAHILEKMKKRNIKTSGRLANAIATIVRLPEAQTGTVFHSKREKK